MKRLSFNLILMGLLAWGGISYCQESPKTPATTPNVPMVRVRLLTDKGLLAEPATVPKVIKTDQEWRQQLTPEQYRITRGKGTEQAFCGAFFDHKKPGLYSCVCCRLPLFSSEAKFDSGTGWPSFLKALATENVISRLDLSRGMRRTEILCARCEAHLGHVFNDGPAPTGLRFCLNSESLVFAEKKAAASKAGSASK